MRIVRSGEPTLRAKGIIAPVRNWSRHPRGRYTVYPWLSPEVERPEIKATHLRLSSICKTKLVCSGPNNLSRIQLTLHATRRRPQGASGSVHCVSAWSGENPTCSVPALQGCECEVYGLFTTAWMIMSTPRPPRYPQQLIILCCCEATCMRYVRVDRN